MTIRTISEKDTNVKCLFCKFLDLTLYNYKHPDYKCEKGETVVNCRGQVCDKWRYCQ